MIKNFNNQKITIRFLQQGDLRKTKQFQMFINRLIDEGAPMKVNQKLSLKQEQEWLKKQLTKIKAKKSIILVAEAGGEIVANCGVDADWGRRSHIGKFCIAVDKDFRSCGIGGAIAREIISLSSKKLGAKILRLSVYPTNKKAIKFYQKLGFKKVSIIPRQIQSDNKLIPEIVMLRDLSK